MENQFYEFLVMETNLHLAYFLRVSFDLHFALYGTQQLIRAKSIAL